MFRSKAWGLGSRSGAGENATVRLRRTLSDGLTDAHMLALAWFARGPFASAQDVAEALGVQVAVAATLVAALRAARIRWGNLRRSPNGRTMEGGSHGVDSARPSPPRRRGVGAQGARRGAVLGRAQGETDGRR